eukprot:RCo019592
MTSSFPRFAWQPSHVFQLPISIIQADPSLPSSSGTPNLPQPDTPTAPLSSSASHTPSPSPRPSQGLRKSMAPPRGLTSVPSRTNGAALQKPPKVTDTPPAIANDIKAAVTSSSASSRKRPAAVVGVAQPPHPKRLHFTASEPVPQTPPLPLPPPDASPSLAAKKTVPPERLQSLLAAGHFPFLEPGTDHLAFSPEALQADLSQLISHLPTSEVAEGLAVGLSDAEVLRSESFIRFLAWQRVQQLKPRTFGGEDSQRAQVLGLPLPAAFAGPVLRAEERPLSTSEEESASIWKHSLSHVLQRLDLATVWSKSAPASVQTDDTVERYPVSFNPYTPFITAQDRGEPFPAVELPLPLEDLQPSTVPEDPLPVLRVVGSTSTFEIVSGFCVIGRGSSHHRDSGDDALLSRWAGQRLDLTAELVATLNPAERAAVRLGSVSRTHAAIVRWAEPPQYSLLNYSPNCTWVAGQPVLDLPHTLVGGEEISVGGLKLRFERAGGGLSLPSSNKGP